MAAWDDATHPLFLNVSVTPLAYLQYHLAVYHTPYLCHFFRISLGYLQFHLTVIHSLFEIYVNFLVCLQ
jgi:hypothetical protein